MAAASSNKFVITAGSPSILEPYQTAIGRTCSTAARTAGSILLPNRSTGLMRKNPPGAGPAICGSARTRYARAGRLAYRGYGVRGNEGMGAFRYMIIPRMSMEPLAILIAKSNQYLLP